MTASQDIIKEFPQFVPLEDIEEKTEEEVITTFYKDSGPTKNWKESMGYYLLNPSKLHFGLKDLK